MNRRTALATLAGTTATALTAGCLDSVRDEEESTADDADRSSGTDGDGDETGVAFELHPYEINECGLTCRDVTSTITNVGTADATDVRMDVSVFADDEHLLDTGESIGHVEAGETVSRTTQIELSVGDARTVQSNDDRVTVEMVIDSDQETDEIVREVPV